MRAAPPRRLRSARRCIKRRECSWKSPRLEASQCCSAQRNARSPEKVPRACKRTTGGRSPDRSTASASCRPFSVWRGAEAAGGFGEPLRRPTGRDEGLANPGASLTRAPDRLDHRGVGLLSTLGASFRVAYVPATSRRASALAMVLPCARARRRSAKNADRCFFDGLHDGNMDWARPFYHSAIPNC
jgi:hypothetical protein